MPESPTLNPKSAESPPSDAELFRLMMENVRDYAIFTTDASSNVTTWNLGAERMFGYRDNEVIGRGAMVIFTPEDIEKGEFRKEFEQAARTGRSEDERWHVRKDGSRFWSSGILTALKDESGGLLGFAKILRDATTRKKADEVHRQLADVLRLASDAIIVNDLNNTVTYWNQAAEHLYGWSREEVVGRSATQLLHTRFPVSFEAVKEALVTDGAWEGELVHTARDGREIIVASRWSLQTDAAGEPAATIEVNRDITERRAAEAELLARQRRIEELNERLQWAMAETHHRVKNNLQVIAALVDMLVTSGENLVPVSELVRLGNHVRALASIHDLLTRQVKESADANSLSARQVLDEVLAVAIPVVDGKGLTSQIEDVPVSVRQGTALAVLTNELVSNAVKHGGGRVRIAFGREGDSARLEVSDSGRGFPADFDSSSAANTGLELVERIARWDLQGTTHYGNRPEGGARVTVEFRL